MAAKVEIDYRDAFLPTMEALSKEGALLISIDKQGKASGMTIGWGSLGIIWRQPIFTVLVRHSRNTFNLVEDSGDFTVNILPPSLKEALGYWGRVSGRNEDKWAGSGLNPAPSRQVRSPIVEQGILHFECRVVHRHDMVPSNLARELDSKIYPSGDYHRIYHGQILACYGVKM
ncbi:MAG: flavin reductase family protein [Chloroflexota bacterium]|jgi:flavin reductase (DIM6/NTAB) family NADH-FMN oxidoreductase RutF